MGRFAESYLGPSQASAMEQVHHGCQPGSKLRLICAAHTLRSILMQFSIPQFKIFQEFIWE